MQRIRNRNVMTNTELYYALGSSVRVGLGTQIAAAFDPMPTTGLAVDNVTLLNMKYNELPEDQRAIVDSQVAPLRSRQQEILDQQESYARRRLIMPSEEAQELRTEYLSLQSEIQNAFQSAINTQIELGNLKTPEELNEEYKDFGYNFQEPMGQERVNFIIDNIKERRLREALVQQGPSGIVPTVLTFGATLGSYIADPLELAAAFVPTVGPARYAAYIRRLGKYRGRALISAREGLVGAALTEPVYRSLAQTHQIDVSMTDSLFNIGIGGAFGAGFGLLRGRLSKRSARDIFATRRRSPKFANDMLKEESEIALRMGIVTGFIDLPNMDVRKNLPIIEFDGIKYQGVNNLPKKIKEELTPFVYHTDAKGNIKVYKRQVNAEKYAGENGTVLKTDEGFVIVDNIKGEIVKKETGEVLSFKTKEEAQKLINNDPDFYDVELKRFNAQVIEIPTRNGKEYAIALDMTPEDAIKISQVTNPENIVIRKGLNAKKKAVLSKPDGGMGDLVYGKNAEKLVNLRIYEAINKRVNDLDDLRILESESIRIDESDDLDASIERIETRIDELSNETDAPILKVKQEIQEVIDQKNKFDQAIPEVIDNMILRIANADRDEEIIVKEMGDLFKKLTGESRQPTQIRDIYRHLNNIIRDRVVDTESSLSKEMIDVLTLEGINLKEEYSIYYKHQKRQHLLQMLAYESLYKRSIAAFEITGDASLGLESALTGSSRLYKGAGIGVDQRTKTLTAYFRAKLIKDLQDRNIMDLFMRLSDNDERLLANVIEKINRDNPIPRSEFGFEVSDNIYKLAQVLSSFNQEFRIRKNNAGSAIRNLQGYITRQTHNKTYIKNNKEIWINSLKESLDFDAMGILRSDIDDFLESTYQSIIRPPGFSKTRDAANGLYDLPPDFPSNIANRLQRERLLKFKSGADWYNYNKQFGKIKSLRESFIADLEATSRSTALLEIFGPNPGYVLQRLKTDLANTLEGQEDNLSRTAFRKVKLETLLDEVSGYSNVAENELAAKTGKFLRAINTVSKLGGATLASITDIFSIANQSLSMGAGYGESISRAFQSLYLGRVAKRHQKEFGEFLAIGMDSFLGSFVSRINATDTFDGNTAKLMQGYFKLNLLSQWTDNAKVGVSMMIARDIAKQSNKSWNQINLDLRRILEQYNITKDNWNIVRQAIDVFPDGKKYISPSKFDDLNLNPKQAEELKFNLISLLDTESDIAVPTPGAFEQAIIKGGYRPGTPIGEAVRAVMQFKAFPITIHTKVLARQKSAYGQTGKWSDMNARGLMGMAQLIAGMTTMGYFALQAKELARGKEPKPFSVSLLKDSFVQGGSAGLLGDILFNSSSRYGQDPLASLLGPTFGQASDIYEVLTNSRDMMFGEGPTSTKVRNDLIRLVRGNTPLTNLFYTREVMNYLVWYQLQEAVNPGYLKRVENTVEQEGQEYIIKPSNHVRYGGGGFK